MAKSKKQAQADVLNSPSVPTANEAKTLATTGIDLETIQKVKELCDRYGAEVVKRMVAEAA